MTKPSIDKIIEHLQVCIADARALRLRMLERVLSMALLQAREDEGHPEMDDD